MAYNPFATVEALRDHIDATQAAQIKGFYSDWAEELEDLAKHFDKKTTSSSFVSSRYYRELKKQVQTGGDIVAKQVQGLTTHNMFLISDAMVKSNIAWLAEFGFPKEGLNAAFSYVPTSVVNSLVTGQVYGKPGSWNLSSAIWSANNKVQSEAYRIVAQGVAQNMPISEIAKSLSAYVNPEKKLLWAGPNGTKIYGKAVDYSAQRLARTLVQHTYQQSFVAMTKDNPFVEEYIWIANGSSACPICAERDGKKYKKNELPLDHPNGMCVMDPVIDDKLVDKLANWVNDEEGTYPEIDEFAKNFGYTPSKKQAFTKNMPTMKLQDIKDVFGRLATSKGLNTWYQKLPDVVKAEVKLFKQQSGKTWDEFYQTEIFKGGKEAYDAKFGLAKAMSFDDAFSAYESQLLKATKDGKYLGKMSKQEFMDLLTIGDIKKIGDIDDFVSKAFTKLGAKTGNSVASAVKNSGVKQAVKNAEEKVQKAATKAKTKVSEALQAARDVLQANRERRRDFESMADAFWKTLKQEQKTALKKYTGNGYINMNEWLRGKDIAKRGTKLQCERLQQALQTASFPEDTVVRRGSDYNMLSVFNIDCTPANKDKLIGSVVEDKGFTSASPFASGGFTYARYEYVIEVPKGSQATYVGTYSVHPSEDELLINCGARFMVNDIEFDSNGNVKTIFMKLINLQS